MAPLEIGLLGADAQPEAYLQLARLHAEEISEGFLTSLGTGMLVRLYRAIGRSPHAFIITAGNEGHIDGFLCASVDTRRVYRDVLVHGWARLLPVLACRLLTWRTVRRCLETLRYPSRVQAPDLPAAEILNFCVRHDLQRSGIGRRLFSAMEAEFIRRGIRQIRIVTGANQQSAIRFYEKLGAEPVGTIEVHARTESRLFRYSIRDCQPEGGAKP